MFTVFDFAMKLACQGLVQMEHVIVPGTALTRVESLQGPVRKGSGSAACVSIQLRFIIPLLHI